MKYSFPPARGGKLSLTYHAIFQVSATVAAFSFGMVYFFIPKSTRPAHPRSLDLAGGLLFLPGIVGLLLSLSHSTVLQISGTTNAFLIMGSIGFLAIWLIHELRHPEPMINVRLLGRHNILMTMIAMALFAMSTLQLPPFCALIFQQPTWTGIGLGFSATIAGALKLPSTLMAIIGSTAIGYLARTFDVRRLLSIGASFSSFGWVLMFFYHSTAIFVVAFTLLISLGSAFLYVCLPMLVLQDVPADRASEATGILTVVRTVFTGIGGQVMLVVMSLSMVHDGARGSFPAPSSFGLAILCLAAGSAGAALVGLFVRRPTGSSSFRSDPEA